jgi:putative acetyltransferase
VIIRPETAADHDTIRKINDEAFGSPIEAKLVAAIRESDRFVPELSLVAVSEGQTSGHVISSYVDVEPGARRVLQVGPLAVLPSHQRRGIGSALMEETIRIADARAEPLLLIEGNPKYYERFGFARADAAGIEPPPEAHGPQYFMIRPLAGYDPAFRGRAIYPRETFGIAYLEA